MFKMIGSVMLGLVLLALSAQRAESANSISGQVTCNGKGFDPVFKYTNTDGWDVTMDVIIGTAGDSGKDKVAKCSAQSVMGKSDGSGTLVRTNFDAGYTDEVPYVDGTNARCDGVFKHYEDSGVEKIKYQTSVTVIVTRKFHGLVLRKTQHPYTIICSVNRGVNHSKKGTSVTVIVTRKFRGLVLRKTQHPYTIICSVERAVEMSTDSGFKVNQALVDDTGNEDVTSTIQFGTELNLYNAGYASKQTALVTPDNDEKVYMVVEKTTADDDLFKFTVETCWATLGSSSSPSNANEKDIFFNNQCHADSTVDFSHTFTAASDQKFKLELLPYAFPTNEKGEIFFHCDLKICLATESCSQKEKSVCDATNPNSGNAFERRKRRAVGSSEEKEVFERQTVTSPQRVLLDQAIVTSPSCGNGFIYDRLQQECSNDRLLKIDGVQFAEFQNTSSPTFKKFAIEKEYQLYVLLRVNNLHKVIRGVKIVRGDDPGKVQVLLKYADWTSPKHAFKEFQNALRTLPSVSRVMRFLNMRNDVTSINFTPFKTLHDTRLKLDEEKYVLIVVVSALFVAVVVSLIVVCCCCVKCGALRRRKHKEDEEKEIPKIVVPEILPKILAYDNKANF